MAVKFITDVRRTHSCGALSEADVGRLSVQDDE
jgi:hypothetical protein